MLNSFYAINYSNVINLNENKLKFGFNLKQKTLHRLMKGF